MGRRYGLFSKHGSGRWRKEAFGDLNQQLNRVGAMYYMSVREDGILEGDWAKEFLENYESLIDLLSLIIES